MRIKPLALLLGIGLGVNAWAYESLPEAQVRAPIYQNTIAKNPLYQQSVASAQTANPLSQSGGLSVTTGQRFNEQYINREIAAWVLRQVNASLSLVEDPWVNQLIGGMTSELNAKVRTQGLYAVPVIADTSINAFATPGGLIGLNTGTVLSSENIDEVASVLAHEVAHLSQRHYEHTQDNQKKLIALQLGGLVAALLASAAGGDAAAVAMIGSQTAGAEVRAANSREHEREADRVGMQILMQAGYDPSAMPRFFNRLNQQANLQQSKNAFIPSFVQSHPLTAERLSEATARASQYPKQVINQSSQKELFDKLTWRLKYVTKQTTTSELTTASVRSQGARLALVSQLADESQTVKAWQVLQEGKFDKSDPLVCITTAHVQTAEQNFAGAVASLQSCQALYPERRDLALQLAYALIRADNPQRAVALITPMTTAAPQDFYAWQALRQAYEALATKGTTAQKQTATIKALQARSHVELWKGEYQGALQSNAQAQTLAKQYAPTLITTLEKEKTDIIRARDFKP